MHKIVMVMGCIAAAMGLIFFILVMLQASQSQDRTGFLPAITIGGGLVVSGAVLYCFGAIVEHLIAIRAAAERQVEIFDKLGKRGTTS